jgi:hypothetical protein
VAWIVTGLMVPVAAASLIVRFRRARGVERLQLRWLVLAAGLAAALVVALAALAPTGNEIALGWVTAVCVALLPLATGAAILRYRLYDLDRIISRTVAYGLLTVLLGGGHAVVVLGLGQLAGRDSTLVVAGATLAVAAAFQPVRRRIQQAVDRRAPAGAATTPPYHRPVQRATAPAGRPGHPDHRAPRGGRPDDAAHPCVALAGAEAGRGRRRPAGGTPVIVQRGTLPEND